jgi:hypothetical protein
VQMSRSPRPTRFWARHVAAHEYTACDDEDCPRYPCRIYREGYADGYGDGNAAGYAAGSADGYAAGAADAG